jgi:predicted RNA binding protein YcfA (HicA-like mRNA interferase family)
MKTPRNVNSVDLLKFLKKYGYHTIRQTGSHIRVERDVEPNYSLTIPNHKPIRIGTLNSIIQDFAYQNNLTKESAMEKLIDSL